MIKIDKPELDPRLIVDDCIAEENVKKEILDAYSNYDTVASKGELYKVDSEKNLLCGKDVEYMSNIYKNKFVRKGSRGRKYYDLIMASTPNNICPYCGIPRVSTLDHFLPKSFYPKYAITYYNLIPACYECNKNKRDYYSNMDSYALIHPYYDKIFAEFNWISADLLEYDELAFDYYADPPDFWSDVLRNRAKKHFQLFNLNKLYKSYSAEVVTVLKFKLIDIYKLKGKIEVKEELNSLIKYEESIRLNKWKTAMYKAILKSDWFFEDYLNRY